MSFWLKSGQENLQRILAYRNNENRAKNVIIFIGDGMGISTITAGRIYKGQIKGNTGEEYKLAFENFPNTGFAKVLIRIYTCKSFVAGQISIRVVLYRRTTPINKYPIQLEQLPRYFPVLNADTRLLD